MRPNARQLAMRDPALAALIGASVMATGADFGKEYGFGAEFGDDDWGDDDWGAEFGDDDYGAEFGLVAPKPTPANVQRAWRAVQARAVGTARRGALLEPNKNSTVKVERYSFSIDQDIILGTAVALLLTGQPDTTIRPQAVTMNAPMPMFATISEIKVANVSVTVGPGNEDAFNYNANGWGRQLDMPTLSPANRATVRGAYTGFVPPGFIATTTVNFNANFKGPATIVA